MIGSMLMLQHVFHMLRAPLSDNTMNMFMVCVYSDCGLDVLVTPDVEVGVSNYVHAFVQTMILIWWTGFREGVQQEPMGGCEEGSGGCLQVASSTKENIMKFH